MASSIRDLKSRAEMKKLRRALARLRIGGETIGVLASSADLPVERINLVGPDDIVWFRVLEEAIRQGDDALRSVLENVREAYPKNNELQEILGFLGPIPDDTGGVEDSAASEQDTGAARKSSGSSSAVRNGTGGAVPDPGATNKEAGTAGSTATAGTQCIILFLASNPVGAPSRRLGEELRELEESLLRSGQRDHFRIENRQAVRHRDLRRAILETSPHIVHFSGHGLGEEGLLFEDESGQASPIPAEALANLFRLATSVRCVVLNACLSRFQAQAISEHIPAVVGTSRAIGDRAAIEFAVAFYDTLFAGKPLKDAFDWGRAAIPLAGVQGQDVMELFGEPGDDWRPWPPPGGAPPASNPSKALARQVLSIIREVGGGEIVERQTILEKSGLAEREWEGVCDFLFQRGYVWAPTSRTWRMTEKGGRWVRDHDSPEH